MDFKVAGTSEGVTALQMDIKVAGITEEIMRTALEQAKGGRAHILGEMAKALDHTRTELSAHAPRIETMQIAKDKIREVIGTGGKVIREITAETGAKVDIGEDGTIKIAAAEQSKIDAARDWIKSIASEPEVGQIYTGKVVKIVDFGISKAQVASQKLTSESALLGTPQYMAPEQAVGRSADVDARADQFSKSCYNYGYHRQVSLGQDVMEWAGLQRPDATFFVAFERVRPFGVMVYEPDAEFIELHAGPNGASLEGVHLADASLSEIRDAWSQGDALGDALPAIELAPDEIAIVVGSSYGEEPGEDPQPPASTRLIRVDASLGAGGLIDLAKRCDRAGKPAADDPVIRDKLVALLIRERALEQSTRRAKVSALIDHPYRIPLQHKLLLSELLQHAARLACEIEGMHGTLHHGDPNAIAAGRWPLAYMNSYGFTIAAGSSEIQRNVLGERVLGLAKSK